MAGGVRKQRGKWIALWREDGIKKSKILGACSEMTKTQARAAVAEIVKRIKRDTNTALFGPFVEGPYFDFYGRKWKESTAYNNKQRSGHISLSPSVTGSCRHSNGMNFRICSMRKARNFRSRSSIICAGT